nr:MULTISPECIES: hypothetical protein [Protofrankia]
MPDVVDRDVAAVPALLGEAAAVEGNDQAVPLVDGWEGRTAGGQLAEVGGERGLLVRAEVLPGEEEDLMVQPCLAEHGGRRRVERPLQVDSGDLGAEVDVQQSDRRLNHGSTDAVTVMSVPLLSMPLFPMPLLSVSGVLSVSDGSRVAGPDEHGVERPAFRTRAMRRKKSMFTNSVGSSWARQPPACRPLPVTLTFRCSSRAIACSLLAAGMPLAGPNPHHSHGCGSTG